MNNATYELSREKNDELHFMKTRYGDCYPHFHRHVELYFVVSGKSDVTINEKTVTLGAGGLAVSTPYDIHSYSRKEEGISYILIVPPRFLGEYFRFTEGKTATGNFITEKEKTEEIFQLFQLLEGEIEDNSLLLRGLINAIFGYIFKEIPLQDAKKTVSSEFVYKVLTHIKAHLAEPITLSSLADAFGYSRFHFSKLFNDNFHGNLSSVLAILRTHTMLSLTENGMEEQEAAKASGFPSMRTFYRTFRQVFGMTFGEYQKAAFANAEGTAIYYNGID